MGENITLESQVPIAIITLRRPEVLNAINSKVASELVGALDQVEGDQTLRAAIITGSDRAFSAGADINEMAGATAADMILGGGLSIWNRIQTFSKPLIAAVSGYALGGGLELAMACDMVVASETARFGQPEINIGIIPGGGGTQRLTIAVGKYKAMEMILSGRMISALEAYSYGLVNKVVPKDFLLQEAKALALEISTKAPLAVKLAKEAIQRAFEPSLQAGLDFEKKCFHLLFSTHDKDEGMKAFIAKRKPEFKGR